MILKTVGNNGRHVLQETGLKTLFVCDIQNLFYAVKQEFGREYRLDYIRLLDLVRQQYRPSRLRAVAYLALSEGAVGKVARLRKRAGYEVAARTSHACRDGRSGTDIDALEVVEQIDSFDLLVMGSGDGDFAPLYQHVCSKGKRVEILTFRSALNREVLRTVSEVHFLDEGVIFSPGAVRREACAAY